MASKLRHRVFELQTDKVRKGEQAVKRPRATSPSTSIATATSNEEEDAIAAKNLHNAQIREAFDNDIKDTYSTLEALARMDKTGVINFLAKPNVDVSFVKDVAKINEITTDKPLYKLKAIGCLAIMRSALADITENDIN